MVLISIDRVEQFPARLWLCFDPEIDPCPTLQSHNVAGLAGVFNALKLL